MTAPLAERGRYRRVDRVATHDYSMIARAVAAIAAAVPTVIGLIAVARVDWSNGGFDAPAVAAAGMNFTPAVAVGTTVVGIIALIAACSRDRGSKLVMGALMVIAAIVIFAAHPTGQHYVLEDNHAWMIGAVGLVLLLAAMAMSWLPSSRVVEMDEDAY